jgi:hypothetical protein
MESLVRHAHALQTLCDKHGWPSCVIGGLALQHWGEARLTRDVDLSVLTGFGREAALTDLLDQLARLRRCSADS